MKNTRMLLTLLVLVSTCGIMIGITGWTAKTVTRPVDQNPLPML